MKDSSSRHEPTDEEAVKAMRDWLDSKEGTIDNRMLRRVCHIAHLSLAKKMSKDAARFRYVLENDTSDLFQYGGDQDEIRDGIDAMMAKEVQGG